MRKLLYKSGTAIGLALLSPVALADTLDQVQTFIFGQVQLVSFHTFEAPNDDGAIYATLRPRSQPA